MAELPDYLKSEPIPKTDDYIIPVGERRKRPFYKWHTYATMPDGRKVRVSRSEGVKTKKKSSEDILEYCTNDHGWWVRNLETQVGWFGDQYPIGWMNKCLSCGAKFEAYDKSFKTNKKSEIICTKCGRKHSKEEQFKERTRGYQMIPKDITKFEVVRYEIFVPKIIRVDSKKLNKIKKILNDDTFLITLGFNSHTKGLLSYARNGTSSVLYGDIMKSPIPEKDKLVLELRTRNSLLNGAPLPGGIWLFGGCGAQGTNLKGDDLIKYMWGHSDPKSMEKWRKAVQRIDELRGLWKDA